MIKTYEASNGNKITFNLFDITAISTLDDKVHVVLKGSVFLMLKCSSEIDCVEVHNKLEKDWKDEAND